MIQLLENRADWDHYLKKAEFKTFFHTWDYREILMHNFPYLKPYYYRFLLPSSAVLLPLFLYNEKYSSLPFCEYGGPVLLKGTFVAEELEQELKTHLIFLPSQKLELKIHPYLFLNQKEKVEERFISEFSTYILENIQHTSLEHIKENLRKTTRQSIIYAQRENLEVKKLEHETELKDFYAIYCATMRRNAALIMPFDYFSTLWKNKNSLFYICLLNQNIISGIVVLVEDNFAHYFISANDSRFSSYHSNQALLWQALSDLKEMKVNSLDFGAVRKGNTQEVFKSGWGTVSYPIYSLCNFEKKMPKPFLRNTWRKLPIFLLQSTSKLLLKRFF